MAIGSGGGLSGLTVSVGITANLQGFDQLDQIIKQLDIIEQMAKKTELAFNALGASIRNAAGAGAGLQQVTRALNQQAGGGRGQGGSRGGAFSATGPFGGITDEEYANEAALFQRRKDEEKKRRRDAQQKFDNDYATAEYDVGNERFKERKLQRQYDLMRQRAAADNAEYEAVKAHQMRILRARQDERDEALAPFRTIRSGVIGGLGIGAAFEAAHLAHTGFEAIGEMSKREAMMRLTGSTPAEIRQQTLDASAHPAPGVNIAEQLFTASEASGIMGRPVSAKTVSDITTLARANMRISGQGDITSNIRNLLRGAENEGNLLGPNGQLDEQGLVRNAMLIEQMVALSRGMLGAEGIAHNVRMGAPALRTLDLPHNPRALAQFELLQETQGERGGEVLNAMFKASQGPLNMMLGGGHGGLPKQLQAALTATPEKDFLKRLELAHKALEQMFGKEGAFAAEQKIFGQPAARGMQALFTDSAEQQVAERQKNLAKLPKSIEDITKEGANLVDAFANIKAAFENLSISLVHAGGLTEFLNRFAASMNHLADFFQNHQGIASFVSDLALLAAQFIAVRLALRGLLSLLGLLKLPSAMTARAMETEAASIAARSVSGAPSTLQAAALGATAARAGATTPAGIAATTAATAPSTLQAAALGATAARVGTTTASTPTGSAATTAATAAAAGAMATGSFRSRANNVREGIQTARETIAGYGQGVALRGSRALIADAVGNFAVKQIFGDENEFGTLVGNAIEGAAVGFTFGGITGAIVGAVADPFIKHVVQAHSALETYIKDRGYVETQQKPPQTVMPPTGSEYPVLSVDEPYYVAPGGKPRSRSDIARQKGLEDESREFIKRNFEERRNSLAKKFVPEERLHDFEVETKKMKEGIVTGPVFTGEEPPSVPASIAGVNHQRSNEPRPVRVHREVGSLSMGPNGREPTKQTDFTSPLALRLAQRHEEDQAAQRRSDAARRAATLGTPIMGPASMPSQTTPSVGMPPSQPSTSNQLPAIPSVASGGQSADNAAASTMHVNTIIAGNLICGSERHAGQGTGAAGGSSGYDGGGGGHRIPTGRSGSTTRGVGSPAQTTFDTTLNPRARGLLDTIAAHESPGYNVMYGGKKFNDFSHHPGIGVPITSGPNAGSTSTAAGRYQFLQGTYNEASKALGLKDFSPASQDKAAWWLAQRDYNKRTHRDLNTDLQSNDPQIKAGIGKALSGTWTSLPHGIESSTNESQFSRELDRNIGNESRLATPKMLGPMDRHDDLPSHIQGPQLTPQQSDIPDNQLSVHLHSPTYLDGEMIAEHTFQHFIGSGPTSSASTTGYDSRMWPLAPGSSVVRT